jgi:hypothetical protein
VTASTVANLMTLGFIPCGRIGGTHKRLDVSIMIARICRNRARRSVFQ